MPQNVIRLPDGEVIQRGEYIAAATIRFAVSPEAALEGGFVDNHGARARWAREAAVAVWHELYEAFPEIPDISNIPCSPPSPVPGR